MIAKRKGEVYVKEHETCVTTIYPSLLTSLCRGWNFFSSEYCLSANLARLLHAVLTCSPVALLLLLRPGLASPTPAIDDSIPASSKISALEERQAVLAGIALGAYGIGFLTGKNVQEFLDEQKYSPGLDRAAGSDCFMSGSWTPKEPVS